MTHYIWYPQRVGRVTEELLLLSFLHTGYCEQSRELLVECWGSHLVIIHPIDWKHGRLLLCFLFDSFQNPGRAAKAGPSEDLSGKVVCKKPKTNRKTLYLQEAWVLVPLGIIQEELYSNPTVLEHFSVRTFKNNWKIQKACLQKF